MCRKNECIKSELNYCIKVTASKSGLICIQELSTLEVVRRCRDWRARLPAGARSRREGRRVALAGRAARARHRAARQPRAGPARDAANARAGASAERRAVQMRIRASARVPRRLTRESPAASRPERRRGTASAP